MESQLTSVGYLYQQPVEGPVPANQPLVYPYASMPKYSLERALFQGTLFPYLDDHWRTKEEAFKAQFAYR